MDCFCDNKGRLEQRDILTLLPNDRKITIYLMETGRFRYGFDRKAGKAF